MGKFTPRPYRVKRENKWVWVYPEPVEYGKGVNRGGRVKQKNTKA